MTFIVVIRLSVDNPSIFLLLGIAVVIYDTYISFVIEVEHVCT